MKKISYILILIITSFSCSTEGTVDCFEAAGTIIEQEFETPRFKKIIVWDYVQLYIKQGENRSVIVETGENLLNEISVTVTDDVLEIKNGNTCNLVRDYGITKVYVTTPELTEITNSSGLTVISEGLINFTELKLISEDPDGLGEYSYNGDFRMENLDINKLSIAANGLSNFYLKGRASSFSINAFDSDVRVEAGELEVSLLYVYHRSTNKIIVNPQISITGEIRGLGDIISKNQPPLVNVEEYYTGKLIFE